MSERIEIEGTAFSDDLLGTGGDDIFDSKGGDDVIDGGAGDDKLLVFAPRSAFDISTLAGITKITGKTSAVNPGDKMTTETV
jgi:Ca2+-binding RTX toxin-like protein